ncbi:MAG: FMN-binding glutamate synthase family protein [Solimonas sp.]
MSAVQLLPSLRHCALLLAIVVLIASAAAAQLGHPQWWIVAALAGLLCGLGVYDSVQTTHAIRRNYPIVGNIRYLIEAIRPEIRQYLIESETEAAPFSRAQRSLVYQRAKGVEDKRPFGTEQDVYQNGYEWINHSMRPTAIANTDFRIAIGGERCTQPYQASLLNISAMSFGALSANAIRALNRGAQLGRFAHDTGEGSISRYHRPENAGRAEAEQEGGDLIWEIGSGYFGCRDAQGRFDADRFTQQARAPQVKMVEVKLSQGAKPGHGGMLPAPKVSAEIAEARGVPQGVDCISPARHSAFSTPVGLLEFVARLRTLSGGKPAGFKFALGHPWEFLGLCKAMLETGLLPDFIVVDGGEGGTGAAPLEFADHIGTPLQEALLLVHNTLVGLNLREKIRIGCSGKIISAFDIARALAFGADWCNSARGFMFALGCVQSQHCHTDRCPTGIATQDKGRQRAIVVPDKAQRVAHFHRNTLRALGELVGAAGLSHPSDLRPHHIVRRVHHNEVRLVSSLYKFLEPGELLRDPSAHALYALYWPMASAHSFDPQGLASA